MKNQTLKSLLSIVVCGLLLGVAAESPATVVANWYSGTLGSAVTDGSPVGNVFTTAGGTWTPTPAAGPIENVNVVLNISGGYNGDLYGYLVYTLGGQNYSHLLLNQVGGGYGTTTAATSGFGGGATTDFASLQLAGVTLTGDGTGSSIQSTPAAANTSYAAAGGSLNTTFGGLNSGGVWTVFLADLATGDQSTLVSWGLELSVVPEPTTWALIGFGGLAVTVLAARRWQQRRTV